MFLSIYLDFCDGFFVGFWKWLSSIKKSKSEEQNLSTKTE